MSATLIASYLIFSTLAGLLGAAAMSGVMQLVGRTQATSGNMVVAVGSLLTRSRENAMMVGMFLHAISAVGFGLIYTLLLIALHLDQWPMSLFAGAGFGVFHGLIVSLSLCWVVADNHPLEEFRHVSISVALTHFFGHIAYGAVVGLVIGFAPV